MVSASHNTGLKKPSYNADGDFVKITFYFELGRDLKKSEEESLINFLQMKQEISIKEVMQYLSVSRNTATQHINKLIKKHVIMRTGKGPATKFIAMCNT